MKTKLLLTAATCFLAFLFVSAQTTLTPQQWDQQKQNRTLDGKAKAAPDDGKQKPYMDYRLSQNNPVKPASNSCQCWQTRDSSWSIVPISGGTPPEYRNDDGSTNLINLPFNFCLYGTNYNSCYINNNGNISFGSPYGTFTASGFPNANFVMVAPFWSDVDTRGGAGLPYYKITPTYMVVQWDTVGYYGSHIDKLNTFQVIITNGSDPIVPGGNVSFCYKDMQWTTGDASQGVGGFGGSDAVVGANKGDGINYIQFGEFNTPGSAYGGPNSPGSGIDWLDNKSFIFDACTNNNNVPPTPSGVTVCDTLHLCEGDSLPFNVTFFSPEINQNTVITIDTTGTTGFVIVSNTPGNTATLVSYFVGSASNAGYNNLSITATDNGSPAGVTTIPIVIQVSPAPIVTISPDTTDCNGPVQLLATGGLSYDWLPTSGLSCNTCPNPIASPTVTTTYTCSITNGCTLDRTVTVFAPPQITITPNTDICQGDTIQITATGGTSYVWAPAAGLSCTTCANPMASPTVTTTYTVIVSNTGFPSCARVDSVTLIVHTSPPVVTITADTSTCYGPVQLNATGGGNYNWLPSGSLSCSTCSSPVAFPTVTTTYVVEVSLGCSKFDSVTVYVPQPLTVSPGTTICTGGNAQLTASGGTGYSWAPSTGLSNPNISNPVATPTVTTTYTVTVSDSNFPSCVRTDFVQVNVVPMPVAVAGNDTTICSGTPANLHASGGTNYSWSPSSNLSNAFIANPVATPPNTTTYIVTVSNGVCNDADTMVVSVINIVATAGPDATICLGESAQLSATGGTSYSWSPTTGLNNPNIANPVASPTVTTTYTCTVTNAQGCTDSDVATITVAAAPISGFFYYPATAFPDSAFTFTDQSSGGVTTYLWNFGDGQTSTAQNPMHSYATSGSYAVCLLTTSANGCMDTICEDVLVIIPPVVAPNVFTPNGDGTNDLLEFRNLEYYHNAHLEIYDRWGALVYKSDNYQNDWNGKKMGTGGECIDGTYYYVLSGSTKLDPMTGFFELIRGGH
jgi:gliding motility-associated-like protein